MATNMTNAADIPLTTQLSDMAVNAFTVPQNAGLPTGPGDMVTIPWGIVIILVLAIVGLWKMLSMRVKDYEGKMESKLEKCEEGHKLSNERILSLTERIARVEGRESMMKELHNDVLEIVRNGGGLPEHQKQPPVDHRGDPVI